ncbi:MAG: peptide ABC transporter substrate-binding protein [Planctomycetota bacterium]
MLGRTGTLAKSAVAVAVLAGALLLLFRSGSLPRADFVFVNSTTPASLDPHKVTGTPEGRLLRALFEGLTIGDPATLAPRPGCAERWEVSADGLVYRFFMRPGLQWSNGDPLNAHDFEWSWRRCLEPATAGKYVNLLWSVVGAREFNRGDIPWDQVGVRAISDAVFEVRLAQPTPWFLSLTEFYPLFPLHRASVEAAERDGVTFTSPERLICNGPYLLAERWLRDRIRMVRNPKYWNVDTISIETIDALAIESDNTALNLFVAGEADWSGSHGDSASFSAMQNEYFDGCPCVERSSTPGAAPPMFNIANRTARPMVALARCPGPNAP